MTRICAWCKKIIGKREPYNDLTITHGICEICFQNQINEIEEEGNRLDKRPEVCYNLVEALRSSTKA